MEKKRLFYITNARANHSIPDRPVFTGTRMEEHARCTGITYIYLAPFILNNFREVQRTKEFRRSQAHRREFFVVSRRMEGRGTRDSY